MSNYTKAVMARIRTAFKSSGMSLEDFGKRMGRPAGTARRAAWQFLNSTSDPRLSMVEKAAKALGLTMDQLLNIPAIDPLAEAIAKLYVSASEDVLYGRKSHYAAVSAISKGTDSVLAGLTDHEKKEWDRWRISAGQEIHGGKSDAEHAAALLNVAEKLRRRMIE